MENCCRFAFYNNICFFFFLTKKQNNQHCVTCYVISMVYTLIDHSYGPISARVFLLHVTSPTWGLHLHLNGPLNSLKIKYYFRKILLNASCFKSSLRIHAWLEECVIQQVITCWVQHIFVLDSLAFVGRKLYFNSLSPGNTNNTVSAMAADVNPAKYIAVCIVTWFTQS